MSTLPLEAPAKTQRRIFADAAAVGVLIALNKLAGAIRIAITARFFGAGDDLDAYLIAFAVVAFFAEVAAGSFVPSLVPALIRARSTEGEDAERRLAREATGFVFAVMLGVSIALAAGTRWILPVVASGFDAEKLRMTGALLWPLILWLPMGALSGAWRATLNARDSFALPAAASLPLPIIAILFLYLGARPFGISVLVAGTLAGVVIETAILGWAIRRQGYPVWPAWSRGASALKGVRRQYGLLVAGAAIASGCVLVDQAVAASMDAGSVSVLAYGTKLAIVLSAIGATAAATVLLPEFSRYAQQREWRPLRRSLRTIVVMVFGLAVPAAALLIWTSGETVRLFFQGGAFQAAESVPVADVQRWALLQLPFAILATIALRLANALSANALIVAASTLALAVNAAGDVWLSQIMGISGIALAGALGQLVLLLSLIVMLWVREPRLFRAGRPA